MVGEKGRLDTAVEQLCDVAEAVLNHTHENVWELDWESLDPTFEDPVHETVSFVKRFRRWQTTGHHGMGLRPR